jgi:hypothetical protein
MRHPFREDRRDIGRLQSRAELVNRATSAVAGAQQKTVQACRAEWQANKAVFAPKGITTATCNALGRRLRMPVSNLSIWSA